MAPTPLIAVVASLFLLAAPTPPSAQLSGPGFGCTGCVGSGSSSSSSGGACGGMLSISVTVTSGKCRWSIGELDDISCRQVKGCVPEVTRSWSGLTPSSPLDFCVQLGEDLLCLEPKPSTGSSGTGEDTRGSAPLGCSDDPGNGRTFSVSSAVCGLAAAATTQCSGCSGVF